MDGASQSVSDEGVNQGSMKSHQISSDALQSPLGLNASSTFAALGGSFPGLASIPPAMFSRAALLHNTSLFNTSSRSMHASNVERLALLRVMSDHLPALETRDTDARTVHKRASVWGEITEKFNASTSVKRNRHQVQTLYKNMKAKAKKYQSRCLDPANSVMERDHVSEMLLGMLNDEYQQRRSVMQQAAIMAFRGDDSSSADFKDHPIARDVSHFLKQEMCETSDMNSTAVLSPQPSVGSVNSAAGDSNSSSGKGATSSHNDKSESTPLNDSQKLPPGCIKEQGDYGLGDVEAKAEFITPVECQKIEPAPQRPESVLMQELNYAQYIAESNNFNKKSVLDKQSDSEPSINNQLNLEQFPSIKKRKLLPENQGIYETLLDIDSERIKEKNYSKTNTPTREKSTIANSFASDICCSSLHDEVLKMKQLEHRLKVKILEQKLEAVCEKRLEEREQRKIEHDMRMKLLQTGGSQKKNEVGDNSQSDDVIHKGKLSLEQDEKEIPDG